MTIKACTFDVFGTVVDWRGSVEQMFMEQFQLKNLQSRVQEVPTLAQTWRNGYSNYNKQMSSGQISEEDFETIDVVHRRLLDDLIKVNDLDGIWTTEELDEINLVWHKLRPWKDSPLGIVQIGEPNPKVYLGACQMLNLKPEEVCMVACHKKDLAGAKQCGLRTAYIVRDGEDDDPEPRGEKYIDHVVKEIADLVSVLIQDDRQ